MERVFFCLSGVESLPELRLTLLVFAKALGNKNQWTGIDRDEMAHMTGFSPGTISRGMRKMLRRGYVLMRNASGRSGGFEYRVLLERLGLPENFLPGRVKGDGRVNRASLEQYFVSAGFFDLLPLACEIAGELKFGEEEMIEAVCKLSDKFRKYPPLINRTAWFARVYREKLLEARADILAYMERRRYRKEDVPL